MPHVSTTQAHHAPLTAAAARCAQIFAFLPNWVETRGLNSVWVGTFVAVQSFGVVVSAACGVKFVHRVGNAIALLLSIGLIVRGSANTHSSLFDLPSPRGNSPQHRLFAARLYPASSRSYHAVDSRALLSLHSRWPCC